MMVDSIDGCKLMDIYIVIDGCDELEMVIIEWCLRVESCTIIVGNQ